MSGTPVVGDIVSVNGKANLGQCTVRFVGKVAGMNSTFLGLELTAPKGKNDGSAKGVSYFKCKPNHGLFVKLGTTTLLKRPEAKPKPSTPAPVATTATAAATPGVTSASSGDVAALKRKISLLETNIEEIKLEKEEMELDKEESAIAVQQAQAEVEKLTEKIKAMEAQQTAAAPAPDVSGELNALKQQLQESSSQIEALKAQLELSKQGAASGELEVQQALASEQAKRAELEKKLAEANASAQSVESELKEKLETQQQQAAEKAAQLESLSQQLKAALLSSGEGGAQLAAQQEQTAALQAQLSKAEATSGAMQQKLQQLAAASDALKAEAKATAAKHGAIVEALQKAAQASEAKVAQLQQESSAKLVQLQEQSDAKLAQMQEQSNAKLAQLQEQTSAALAQKASEVQEVEKRMTEMREASAGEAGAMQTQLLNSFESEKAQLKTRIGELELVVEETRLNAEEASLQAMEKHTEEIAKLTAKFESEKAAGVATQSADSAKIAAEFEQQKQELSTRISELELHAEEASLKAEEEKLALEESSAASAESIAALKAQLAAAETAKTQLQQQLEAERAALQEGGNKSQQISSELTGAIASRDALQAQLTEAEEARVSQIKALQTVFDEEKAALTATVATLEAKVAESAEQFSKFQQASASSSDGEKKGLLEQIQNLNGGVEQLKAAQQGLQDQRAALRAELTKAQQDALDAEAAAVEAIREEAESERAALQKELVEQRSLAESSKTALAEKEAAMKKSLEDAFAQSKSLREAAQAARKESNSEKEALRKKLKEAEESHAKALADTKAQAEAAAAEAEPDDDLDDLMERLEMVTLDKEFAEERVEELEGQLASIQAKLAALEDSETQRKVQAESIDSSTLSSDAQLVFQQNEKLKQALQQVKTLMVAQAAETEEKLSMLKEENELLPMLEEQVTTLEEDLAAANTKISELGEALDERGDVEQMVEELSEQKMELQEKVEDLEATVHEMEELAELGTELEIQQKAEEESLKKQLRQKEIALLDAEGIVHNLKNQVIDAGKSMKKFRVKVSALNMEVAEYRDRAKELSEQERNLLNSRQELRDQNIQLQASVVKDKNVFVNAQVSALNAAQATTKLEVVMKMLPETFFRRDFECLSLVFLSQRWQKLLELIDAELDSISASEAELANRLKRTVAEVAYWCARVEGLLQRGTEADFRAAGTGLAELKAHEKPIGDLLEKLKKGELTRAYSEGALLEAAEKLRQLVGRVSTTSHVPGYVDMLYEAQRVQNELEDAGGEREGALQCMEQLKVIRATLESARSNAIDLKLKEKMGSLLPLPQDLKQSLLILEQVSDELLTSSSPETAAAKDPTWISRAGVIRAEITRILGLEEQLVAYNLEREQLKKEIAARDAELIEGERKFDVVVKKLGNSARKSELTQQKIEVLQSEIEELRVYEEALDATKGETAKLEQENMLLNMKLEEIAKRGDGEGEGGATGIGSGVPMSLFNSELQGLREAVARLQADLRKVKGSTLKQKLLSSTWMPAKKRPSAPQQLKQASVGKALLQLQNLAAGARLVDLSKRQEYISLRIEREKIAKQHMEDVEDSVAKLPAQTQLRAKISFGGGEGRTTQIVLSSENQFRQLINRI